MRRILMIADERTVAESGAVGCRAAGVTVEGAETLCDGVRSMFRAPVSLVVVEASLMRLSGSDQVRLFDLVAPGVPVVVVLEPDSPLEDQVVWELRGFRVVSRPLDVRALLAAAAPAPRPAPAPAPADAAWRGSGGDGA
jgi:DNA-binding response OmpR family regulator